MLGQRLRIHWTRNLFPTKLPGYTLNYIWLTLSRVYCLDTWDARLPVMAKQYYSVLVTCLLLLSKWQEVAEQKNCKQDRTESQSRPVSMLAKEVGIHMKIRFWDSFNSKVVVEVVFNLTQSITQTVVTWWNDWSKKKCTCSSCNIIMVYIHQKH